MTVTALLETGSLPSVEPETVVRIDTAVGWSRRVRHVVAPDDPFPTGLTVGDICSPASD